MGHARNRPKLLHLKLTQIRGYLKIDLARMAETLRSEIASHCGREIRIERNHISKFELDRSEPDLLMMIGYARLASVRIESLVDDGISVDVFRILLGKEFKYGDTESQHKQKRAKAKA